MLRPAVFLDRDGTLMEEVHYCADPALVRVFPGTAAALRRLVERGFLCVLITNQSGIGRGLLTEEQYQAVQCELLRQLEAREGKAAASPLITASYYCPDAPPTPSPRRKPEPGMVREAACDLGIDLARSWFVGDKAADIACGRRAGTRTILVQTGYGAQTAAGPCDPPPHFVAKEIVAAVEIVVQNSDAIRP
ncbi:MAG: HAD family hydrolase [Chthoniobacteraceae bacterium]|nr:HAD family hydrolase [Chthoniobacteraceae bacterium]